MQWSLFFFLYSGLLPQRDNIDSELYVNETESANTGTNDMDRFQINGQDSMAEFVSSVEKAYIMFA